MEKKKQFKCLLETCRDFPAGREYLTHLILQEHPVGRESLEEIADKFSRESHPLTRAEQINRIALRSFGYPQLGVERALLALCERRPARVSRPPSELVNRFEGMIDQGDSIGTLSLLSELLQSPYRTEKATAYLYSAILHQRGLWLPKSFSKATKYSQIAFEHGDDEIQGIASLLLGNHCQRIRKDERAVKYYCIALEKGSDPIVEAAQQELSKCARQIRQRLSRSHQIDAETGAPLPYGGGCLTAHEQSAVWSPHTAIQGDAKIERAVADFQLGVMFGVIGQRMEEARFHAEDYFLRSLLVEGLPSYVEAMCCAFLARLYFSFPLEFPDSAQRGIGYATTALTSGVLDQKMEESLHVGLAKLFAYSYPDNPEGLLEAERRFRFIAQESTFALSNKAEAYSLLGDLYKECGDLEKAKECYLSGLQLGCHDFYEMLRAKLEELSR